MCVLRGCADAFPCGFISVCVFCLSSPIKEWGIFCPVTAQIPKATTDVRTWAWRWCRQQQCQKKEKAEIKKKNTRKRNSRAIGITPNPDTPTPSAVSTLPAHTHIMLAKLTWPLIGPSTWVSIINGIPCVPFISVCCCWLEDVEYTDRQSADSSLSHLATYLIAAYPLVYLFCSSILLSWPFLLRFPAFFAVQNQYK